MEMLTDAARCYLLTGGEVFSSAGQGDREGHMRLKRRWTVAISGAGAVGLVMGGLTLSGVTFATPTSTYSACIARSGAFLYNVTVNGTANCRSHDTLISWNAQGPKGTKGTQGLPGQNGKSILSGTTTPSAGTGTTGDFYLDTTTESLYGPKAAGAWPPTGVRLIGPKGTKGSPGPNGPVCAAPKTSSNDLEGDDLVGCTLTAATLASARLTGANLTHASLTGAHLTRAGLFGSNMVGATFINASLFEADGRDATFKDAYMLGANMIGATLIGADFTDASLTSAYLTSADLIGADMTDASLTTVVWTKTTCPDRSTSTTDGGTCVGHLT